MSGQGIKLNVDGVAIVKVGGNEDSIRAAAQRFLSQQDEIETFTQETLAGSLRSIVGSLTVEQIIRDRAAFAQRVTDESESSLTGQGLVLDTFQIQDITDDGTYLSDLGRPESARVGRLAAIAEAEARREAEQAQIAAEQEIAISQRALVLKQAEIQAETDAARAQAASAGPLAQADRDQAILQEQEKVAVAQAALKERQLDTEVRRPADAERYRVETAAEAQRNAAIFDAEGRKAASIANAEAEAEKARLTGVGEKSRRSALAEAEAIEGARVAARPKARRVAEADAVRAEGEAKAAAVLAVGQAEAEAMDKRAEAFKNYNDAAVLQMLVEILPVMAEKVAAPLGSIDKLTVVSTDGASQLPRQVTDTLTQTIRCGRPAPCPPATRPSAATVVRGDQPAPHRSGGKGWRVIGPHPPSSSNPRPPLRRPPSPPRRNRGHPDAAMPPPAGAGIDCSKGTPQAATGFFAELLRAITSAPTTIWRCEDPEIDREEHQRLATVRCAAAHAQRHRDRAGHGAARHHRRDHTQRVGRRERDRALGDEGGAEQPRRATVLDLVLAEQLRTHRRRQRHGQRRHHAGGHDGGHDLQRSPRCRWRGRPWRTGRPPC